MKRTIIICVGKEGGGILPYLDYIIRLSQNVSIVDLIRAAVITTEDKNSNINGNSYSKLNIQQIIINGKENDDSEDLSSIVGRFIHKSEVDLNKESIVSEHRDLMVEPGINLVFLGFAHNPIFRLLLENFRHFEYLEDKIYISTFFTNESFIPANLPTSLSVAKAVNQLSFSNLSKKVIMTDVNREGNTVSIDEIYSNFAGFLYNYIINTMDSNLSEFLKVRTDLFKTKTSGSLSTIIDCNFVSTGNSILFLPIESLRCGVAKDLSNKFVNEYFKGRLVTEERFINSYKVAKAGLIDLISYNKIGKMLNNKLEEIIKEEGFFYKKLSSINAIPLNKLVEELINYQTLLLSGDLHIYEQSLNNWLKDDFKISSNFLQKIKTFEELIVSKNSFILLTKALAKLLEDITIDLRDNFPKISKKTLTKTKLNEDKDLNGYQFILLKKISMLPKSLPYYIKYSLLGVFLGYLGFLGAKYIYISSFKGLLLPYIIAAAIISLILFFAWFGMWKQRREILYIANEWKDSIESNYEDLKKTMIHRVVSSAFEKEIEITKQEIGKYKQKIANVKNSVLEQVVSKAFLECPKYKQAFRFTPFGEEYYKKKMSEKLSETERIFYTIGNALKIVHDQSFFENSDPHKFANEFLESVEKAAYSIVKDNDSDISISSILQRELRGDEAFGINMVSEIKSQILKSAALVSLNHAFACEKVNFTNERHLFLPQPQNLIDKESWIKLLSNQFTAGTFKGTYLCDSCYLLTVSEVVYDFPIRSISYFVNLKNDFENNNLPPELAKKVKWIIQEKEGD